jgi:mannitol/fructose-specific phosphotransferase system IIA component (Ntr-type)
MNEEFIELNAEYNTKEELIRSICKKLKEANYVSDGFEESILMREERFTTEVGSGVAVPHGAFDYVNTPIMIYIKLKEAIKWKEELVDKVLLFCAREKDTAKFIKFFRNFYNVIETEDEKRKLESFRDKRELKSYLEDIFYDN